MRARCATLALVAGAASFDAAGDLVTLNHWDARVNFGVLADGGSQSSPIQGPVEMVPGTHALTWDRVDGVAMARAGTQYTLALADSPDALAFTLDMKTEAFAEVGPCPAYPEARGMAEAWFDYASFDFTLWQPAVLTVMGTSLGGYDPGVHLLQPGEYALDMMGPTGLSWVSVGPANAARSGSDFAASFHIGVVPVPAGGLGLLGGLALSSRRPRR